MASFIFTIINYVCGKSVKQPNCSMIFKEFHVVF
jgi:hypothetical protein